MKKSFKPGTVAFLVVLGITIFVWVLRGLGVLSFLPSSVIWFLLFLTIGTGVVNSLQGAR